MPVMAVASRRLANAWAWGLAIRRYTCEWSVGLVVCLLACFICAWGRS